MGVTSRLLLLGRKLPSLGRLAWLRSPNAPDSKYSLPISCFAAVGVGPFFSFPFGATVDFSGTAGKFHKG